MSIPSLLCLFLCACCAAPRRPAPSVAAPARAVELLLDGSAIAYQTAQVLSIDDENRSFEITFESRVLPSAEQPHTPVLRCDRREFASTSWGQSGATSLFTFHASAEEACELAAALGVPAVPRAPLRIELAGRLEPAGEMRAEAEHLPLRFTLTNHGPEALWFLDGGRGRNELGRDNRFTFVVECDGVPVATRELTDFGGLGRYRRLAPGGSCALELDLAHWCAHARAGRYRVHASYAADLMPAEFEPGRNYPPGWYTHIQRSRALEAELALELR